MLRALTERASRFLEVEFSVTDSDARWEWYSSVEWSPKVKAVIVIVDPSGLRRM
jgi:hypothetical protein